MERTKLTSIRLETGISNKIDQIAAKHTYWKRSAVINNLLQAVLNNFNDGQIYDMMCTYRWRRNIVKTDFTITDELRPLK